MGVLVGRRRGGGFLSPPCRLPANAPFFICTLLICTYGGVGRAPTRWGKKPMDRYPVDQIDGKTSCVLHQWMKNISMKVAVGYALSCEPGVTWHSRRIPDGYARVGVDEIVPGYESLELDMAGPEDEATLGEVLGGVILWNKKDIKFLGLAPPPPPLPLSHCRSPSPRSPPHDYDDHHSASPSQSPSSGQPSSSPLTPTKPSLLPLAPTKLQGQKRKRTTTSGTHSSGTR
jgi:hypothetical protein